MVHINSKQRQNWSSFQQDKGSKKSIHSICICHCSRESIDKFVTCITTQYDASSKTNHFAIYKKGKPNHWLNFCSDNLVLASYTLISENIHSSDLALLCYRFTIFWMESTWPPPLPFTWQDPAFDLHPSFFSGSYRIMYGLLKPQVLRRTLLPWG